MFGKILSALTLLLSVSGSLGMILELHFTSNGKCGSDNAAEVHTHLLAFDVMEQVMMEKLGMSKQEIKRSHYFVEQASESEEATRRHRELPLVRVDTDYCRSACKGVSSGWCAACCYGYNRRELSEAQVTEEEVCDMAKALLKERKGCLGGEYEDEEAVEVAECIYTP